MLGSRINTFITRNSNNMNIQIVLNILHIKMTCPILRWLYFKGTDLTDVFVVVILFTYYRPPSQQFCLDLQAYSQGRFIYCK